MTDVAKLAGVSLGTVSNVVNGLPVNEAYRTRVETAIRELDYHVNTSGRTLKTGRSRTIALIIPNTRLPFFGQLVNEVNFAVEELKIPMDNYGCCVSALVFTEYR